MPARFADEGTGCPSSDTTLPHMEIETVVSLEAEKMCHSISSATDLDAVSNTSVTFLNEQTATLITHAADWDAERKNSSTSQVEQKRFPAGLDAETSIVDTSDNDASSTATSDDSSDEDGSIPSLSEQPQPFEPNLRKIPEKPPTFEADPVRYILGMKLITAESGFCMCSLATSSYAIVFYITCYASVMIADSFGVIPSIIRTLYAFKFQLFLTYEQQHVLHGWLGIFLLLSAFVLWLATYKRSRPILQVWMMVMLLFVMMDLTVWLLGFLLSFAADGWNVHSTTAISIGMLEVGMEVYLLHMVYTFNRYMFEKPPRHDFYDPRVMLRRQMELAQHGYHEINIMGVPLPAPIPGHPVHQIRAQQEQRQRQQQQRQQQQRQQVTAV